MSGRCGISSTENGGLGGGEGGVRFVEEEFSMVTLEKVAMKEGNGVCADCGDLGKYVL